MPIVYSGGTFDLFHAGHVELLRACRRIAGDDGQVVVALNTDQFVAEFKGAAPTLTYGEREAALLSCRYVDRVIENVGGPDSRTTILRFYDETAECPDFVVIGSDWAPPRDYHAQMGWTPGWLAERGIILLYVDRAVDLSTTAIKARVRDVAR